MMHAFSDGRGEAERTITAHATRILETVRRVGWVKCGKASSEEFSALCAAIGTTVGRHQVMALAEARSGIQGTIAIPLHNDGLMTDVIAWRCVARGLPSEATRFVDVLGFERELSADVLDVLARVVVDHPLYPEGYRRRYLIERVGGRLVLNYVPWRIVVDGATQRAAVGALAGVLGRRRARSFAIHLERSELLFVDNFRLLHERPELRDSRGRHLERLLLRVRPTEDAA